MTSSTVFQHPDAVEKPQYVRSLFGRIAAHYDRINDLMTLGLHRLWKKQACRLLHLPPRGAVLDVCCGTGDLSFYLARIYPDATVTGLDFCEAMLEVAQTRAQTMGKRITFCQGDALALPFAEASFQGAVIGYGLRNVADYSQCLRELFRVLSPGARLVILDMSHPARGIQSLSTLYQFQVLPILGRWLARDAEAYRYLPHSVSRYPTQQALVTMLQSVGFQSVGFENRLGGICALHWGTKTSGRSE